MVNTMKQSEYVYVVYSALFTEFPEYSSVGHPVVCVSADEAEEVFDKLCDTPGTHILFDRCLEDFRHRRIQGRGKKVLEVKLVKCPVLFDAYQFGELA